LIKKSFRCQPETTNGSDFQILLNLAKNHDLFYSPADLRYCKFLFKKLNVPSNTNNKETFAFKIKQHLNKLFKNYIFDSTFNFRYTLRFISTQTVCILIVYLISIAFVTIIFNFTEKALFNDIPENTSNRSALIFCQIKFIFCSNEGKLFYLFDPQQEIDIIGAISALIIVPIFFSVLICFMQIVNGINNYKRDYLFLAKGKNPFISNASLIDNQQIGVFNYF